MNCTARTSTTLEVLQLRNLHCFQHWLKQARHLFVEKQRACQLPPQELRCGIRVFCTVCTVRARLSCRTNNGQTTALSKNGTAPVARTTGMSKPCPELTVWTMTHGVHNNGHVNSLSARGNNAQISKDSERATVASPVRARNRPTVRTSPFSVINTPKSETDDLRIRVLLRVEATAAARRWGKSGIRLSAANHQHSCRRARTQAEPHKRP